MPGTHFDFSERLRGGVSRMDLARIQVGQLWRLRPELGEVVDDLLDLVSAVHVADRLVKRSEAGGNLHSRTLSLTVPVASEAHWTAHGPLIQTLLAWLTGDDWRIAFNSRLGRRRTRVPFLLGTGAPNVPRPFVGLYSGGLDSLAGAVAQALDPQFRTAVLVGGQSGGSLKALQTRQFKELQARLPQVQWEPFCGFWHQGGKRQLADWFLKDQRQEKSQRSRALLFLVLGAVTALAYDTDTLYVYENGVGAINLPYTAAFAGVDQTRAMHPRTLLLMGQWLSSLLGRPLQIRNASLWRTKGEMCAQLEGAGLGDLAALSASCDSYPLREARKQCGTCTSCIMRRLSLHAGGLEAEDRASNLYREDLYERPASHPAKQFHAYRYMQQQAEQYAALATRERMVEFRLAFAGLDEARSALHQSEGLTLAEVDARLTRLYQRYAAEMARFGEALTPTTAAPVFA